MIVTGGAGFVGSHLVDRLVERGDSVVVVDNVVTGSWDNLAHLGDRIGRVEADVSTGLGLDGLPAGPPAHIDAVLHLASPASPPAYLQRPLETLAVGSEGTRQALEVARVHHARFLLASTSEIYGDPEVHPQPESYLGNVNSIGPRSCYDEAKRFAEALTMAYARAEGVSVRIARLFNTYGPRLRAEDGRVVSNLLTQAMEGRPMSVYGDGTQTRSFGYVDDTVDGLIRLLDSDVEMPVNLGTPTEFSVLELVEAVRRVTGTSAEVVHLELPADDPTQRQPDITRARELLGWEPKVGLMDGLARYADWLAGQA
ncbi:MULTISPECIES: NAD-dependent epimerase/dehydratase family protein [Candidatus Neomicrothrix]|uniref:NAD-dependent epimerase/dehydratase family protein n=1 Tax=Candidatus Neomicrothrix TaxID=41949 RepID=UPI0004B7E6CD|nr:MULTISPECIES: NAD-dependent epimerase/dehydratase family protein [Microthrix]NLH67566.1 NAD-dependent epimerase/dehydratase family protein [Candidatus Microthrix parvicella]MBK6501160.1 GDP-mannose 4,6-dehydratase [Candidatus Microthrix sp.]MBK7019772.1 GDP-mannose 4,6-dehydratase [Candidatus Microthrix sp.]MBK7323601.1 GDP-mannose 4,6-dehydratase [Candidatus Microthrix sp.]MBP6134014.1 GDP-mannose 4,6-dehydratase [Candidatus Microthrix sp.]